MRSLEAINVNIGAKQLSPSIITLWHAKEKKMPYISTLSTYTIVKVVKNIHGY